MDIDVDKKLYNDYLNGNTESFKTFYLKYKDKIKYFIFGIVKDYEKAEDITQEVFIYILKNKYNENSGSLKYYIYLIAKSKAISYINKEKRRNDITEKYLNDPSLYIENDIFETIAKQETKKDIIESINLINEKFRDSVYLVKIGGLSYKEVADILNISEQDVKNYVHRGKNELRKILIKKGYEKMNKSLKVFIIVMCLSALMAGVIYAVSQVYEKIKDNAEITPTFTSQISTIDTNKVWVGTFNLVWNDFMNDVIKGNIEFENGYSELAEQLNKQSFTIDQLNANSYFKIHGKENLILKNQIEEGIKKKFNETSSIIDKCDWKSDEYYVLYAMLKKKFNYLEKFPTLEDNTFGNSEVKIKYFGIEPDTIQNASINIEVLFYNSDKDFAIKLKTKEKEEVYLYKTDGIGKSFEDNYKEMIDKQSRYTGENLFLMIHFYYI